MLKEGKKINLKKNHLTKGGRKREEAERVEVNEIEDDVNEIEEDKEKDDIEIEMKECDPNDKDAKCKAIDEVNVINTRVDEVDVVEMEGESHEIYEVEVNNEDKVVDEVREVNS